MVVGIVYFFLTLFTLTVWLVFVDWSEVPSLMLAYVFPYPHILMGGGALVMLLVIVQTLAFMSAYYAVVVKKGLSAASDTMASLLAVGWYLGVSFSIVVANIR
ncbi:MAG: hypothetical protein KZQ73_16345 [Candidatus Thiodiazotropha sp. (ex Semelilucina semeliformis)]|nr:hypothetical protein [Candidatus Thiodiazotropha sp. (ex Myrtea spinifera)]MCU7809418.1 hypothetical protein [Candidatus Thiodiazotropha sp. (ex Semelilucina semeliformis)]